MILKNLQYLLLPFVLISITSCQKEISINLNASNPRYVIEADLSDAVGESKVKITNTLNFDENTNYPPVRNALVTILDKEFNHLDTLLEGSKFGIYSKPLLKAVSGHTYVLTIQVDGKLFTSTSTMPDSIGLESIEQEQAVLPSGPGGGGGPGSGGGGGPLKEATVVKKPKVNIIPHFKDAFKIANQYQIVISRNDTVLKDLVVRSDDNLNGVYAPIRVEANVKDIVGIDLQCIDKVVYTYLREALTNTAQSSATPSNPVSNISNGALGYFKVHSSSKKTILIK